MTNFRYTLRFLATHKSFTAAAVFTLAIGLGANTALFGLVNLASRPLEIPHPEQLVSIAAETRGDDRRVEPLPEVDRLGRGHEGVSRRPR